MNEKGRLKESINLNKLGRVSYVHGQRGTHTFIVVLAFMTPANWKTRGTSQPQTMIGNVYFDTRQTRNTCAIVVAFMTPKNGKTTGTTQSQTIGKADLDTRNPTEEHVL